MHKDGEPSVEDILRSIKQVISRDDEAAAGQGGSSGFHAGPFAARQSFARQPLDTPVAANAPASPMEEDIYDLGEISEGIAAAERAEADQPVTLPAAFAIAESGEDGDNAGKPETGKADAGPPGSSETASAGPAPVAGQPEPASGSDNLIAEAAAAAVREQLATLSNVSAAAPQPASANPLEDMVREMLRPMLKEWLDANLQGIIERIVQDEIARITGRR